jgi:hypothetical protein
MSFIECIMYYVVEVDVDVKVDEMYSMYDGDRRRGHREG